MGLTNSSTGIRAVDSGLEIRRQTPEDRVVALAGNPNVGKSTVFNGLTGLNQHTGNWPGKTVASAQGFCATRRHSYVMVDIPGTYSLMAHSAEEEVARNFICFGEPDAVVVVCDATCLERNLNLVLQTMEISSRVLVCVNLLDEAKRKGIQIDLGALSARLGVPVVGAVARKKQSLGHLMSELDRLIDGKIETHPLQVRYLRPIEDAIGIMEPLLRERFGERINPRWLSLRLLDAEPSLMEELKIRLGKDPLGDSEISAAVLRARDALAVQGITDANIKDKIVSCLVLTAEDLCLDTVACERNGYNTFDRRIDRILTSRWAGYPIMLLLLALVFWLTITGANIPSQLLADLLFRFQDNLTGLFLRIGAPDWLHGMLVLGAYRVLAWVVYNIRAFRIFCNIYFIEYKRPRKRQKSPKAKHRSEPHSAIPGFPPPKRQRRSLRLTTTSIMRAAKDTSQPLSIPSNTPGCKTSSKGGLSNDNHQHHRHRLHSNPARQNPQHTEGIHSLCGSFRELDPAGRPRRLEADPKGRLEPPRRMHSGKSAIPQARPDRAARGRTGWTVFLRPPRHDRPALRAQHKGRHGTLCICLVQHSRAGAGSRSGGGR